MKLNATISKILANKYVLYIIYIISLLNIIGYLVYGKIDIVILFLLLAFLTSKFSKNMVIVLGLPIILVNLFAMKNNYMEGLENNNKDKESKKEMTPEELKKTVDKVNNTKSDIIVPSSTESTQVDESFEVGRKKKGNYEIDYASTVEEAYDELNKIIGGDGMQKLTGDTQNLIKQQMELTKAMEGMAPLIQGMAPLLNQAKGLLGSMDNGNLGSIADMAKKFTAGVKPE
jgi:hypothetical protein